MNERIREIAEQAGFNPYNYQGSNSALFEKFAELIVRECVQTLLNNTPEQFTNEATEEDWDRGYGQAMRDCVHHIKQHFGIES